MIYPPNIEIKLGFKQIRESIKNLCISELGVKYVEQMSFSNALPLLRTLHQQTAEFLLILQEHSGFPTQNYYDLRPELKRISIAGSYFTVEALFDFRASVESIFSLRNFIMTLESDDFPLLQKLGSEIVLEKILLRRLQAIISEKGEINSNASPRLSEIRQQLVNKEGQIGNKIRAALHHAKKAAWTDDDAEIVLRNGRLLVPIKASDKRKLSGFIHDQSSTGQTVYVEPMEVFDINNEIRELQNEERAEIIRILKAYTEEIRPFIPDFFTAYRILGIFDFIRAKSLYAQKINALLPKVKNERIIQWKEAIHPLLFLSLKEQNKKVVPLNIELNEQQRILIISGPNAGGKSVSLKTLGLLQYMFQCGLLVPVNKDSTFGIFNDIFIDIGDEQSIENDLSTYSSHLKNMAYFIRKANARTLFLIDEFGTGTEPQLGGAIAEAVLESLYHKNALGVVTTHYANLKLMAGKYKEMSNGAMLFDHKILSPIYELLVGKPGSSFAFEIAYKTGLPKKVLASAKKKISKAHLNFDKELQQLESEKKQLAKEKNDIAFLQRQLQESKDTYEAKLNHLKEYRAKYLEEAKKEAEKVVADSNKMIEKTISDIRKSQANKEKTKSIRKDLKEKQEKLLNNIEKPIKKAQPKGESKKPVSIPHKGKQQEFEIGDFVKVIDSEVIGEIVQLKGKDIVLSFNQIKLTVQKNKLEYTNQKKAFKKLYGRKSKQTSAIMRDLSEKANSFNTRLDLRGKRAEEALSLFKHYLDEAIMLKIIDLEIVHGKGDGILRKLIRAYLSSIPEVKSYQDQHIERGGSGITLVRL